MNALFSGAQDFTDGRYDAIYSRQSIEKEDSLSIETQFEFAEALCSNKVRHYSDPGYSGKDLKRPEIQKLLKDVENGEIKRIIVYRLDRLTRSLFDLVSIWQLLSAHDAEFVSATEQLSISTPMGKMMVLIITMVAEWERDNTVARVTDNYYKRAAMGRWTGGPAPYGYVNSKILVEDFEIPTLGINWEQMKTLQWMHETYAAGTSIGGIRKLLNEKKTPSPNDKNWTDSTVARNFRSPTAVKTTPAVYAYYKAMGVNVTSRIDGFTGDLGGLLVGKLENGTTRKKKRNEDIRFSVGNWEGCIDADLWLANQNRMNQNVWIGRNGTGNYTWLTGLIKCGYCKKAVTVFAYVDRRNCDKPIARQYLRCSSHLMGLCDHILTFSLPEVETCVLQELQKVLDSCKNEPITNSILQPEEISAQIELVKIEEEIQNLMKVLSSSAVNELTIQYVNKELENLKKKEEKLLLMVQGVTQRLQRKYVPETIVFGDLDFEQQKVVANSYIDKVYIYKVSIEIKWKI